MTTVLTFNIKIIALCISGYGFSIHQAWDAILQSSLAILKHLKLSQLEGLIQEGSMKHWLKFGVLSLSIGSATYLL